MLSINFNKLYYFYVVAKEGSVKAASQKIHLTQPTISTQIRQLEDSLNVQLFIRKHRKLELTQEGKKLLKKSEKLFSMAEDIVQTLPKTPQTERTPLRIGAIQSLANSFIYDFSLKLWELSHLKTTITQGSFEVLLDQMNAGELDMVLSDNSILQGSRYTTIHLNQDKMFAVASPKNKPKSFKFPDDLTKMSYLAFSNQGRLQNDIDYFFELSNLNPERIGEVDDVTLMRIITENSPCFSIMPSRAVRESIRLKKLVKLGELSQVQVDLWAIVPSLASNKNTIKRLLNDYFKRQH